MGLLFLAEPGIPQPLLGNEGLRESLVRRRRPTLARPFRRVRRESSVPHHLRFRAIGLYGSFKGLGLVGAMLGKTLDRVSGSLGKNIEFSRHFWIAKAASPCWSSRLGVIKKGKPIKKNFFASKKNFPQKSKKTF